MSVLLLILFPKKVYRFQIYLIEKLHTKYKVKKDLKYLLYEGVIFVIISILLFAFSITCYDAPTLVVTFDRLLAGYFLTNTVLLMEYRLPI